MKLKSAVGFLVVFGVASCGDDGKHESGGAAGAPVGASSNAGSGATASGNSSGGSTTAGSAGSSAPDAGEGATSAAGGGDPNGNQGGAGGMPSADPDGDPLPATPDLTGLIAHSTKWMLVSLSWTANSKDDIQLLDLETNELTPANPDGAINVASSLSPDERTFFFSNGNGAALSERIIHLEPNGFTPARKLKDYEAIPGAYRVLSWAADSRFAMVSRGAGASSIELIDMWLEKRVHTEAFSSHVAGFAPAGYAFFYDAALSDGYEPRYARVTQAGTSPIQNLPPDAANMVFDASGTHLFYSLGGPGEGQQLFRRSLVDGETQELVVSEGEEEASGYDMLPLTDSVLVSVQSAPNVLSHTRRAFFDTNEPWVEIADRLVEHHSDDNNLLIIHNQTDQTLDLVRVEPFVSHTLPSIYVETNDYTRVGIVGDHAYYVAADGLHINSLSSAGELRDEVVSAPGKAATACANPYSYEPKHKFAFLEGDLESLVFVDLTQEPPAVVGRFDAPTGSKVSCPRWGDGDTALGIVAEAADKSRSIYYATWKGSAPETPMLALPSGHSVYAVMYR